MGRPKKKGIERWKRGRLGEKQLELGEFMETLGVKKTYKQQWSAYNLAQTEEFKLFQDTLIELIDSLIQVRKLFPKKGRQFMDLKDMLFCCVMKVYFGKSTRRNTGYLSLAKGLNYIKKVPHFNTLLRYYNNPSLTQLLKHLIEQSGIPLKELETQFTTDSSGFSTSLFTRWFNIRVREYREKRLFKKAHLTTGTKTNVITAVSVTEGYRHDSPEFEQLVRITAKNFNMREMSADAGYLSRNNFDIVHSVGAIPYIMFRSDSTSRARGSMVYSKMYKVFRDNKKFWMEKYHKRSNAESVFNMIKRKFGMHLFCRNEIAQINEILCKCLAHNICVLIQELFEANTILDFREKCEPIIVRNYGAD
jgi:transposase